MYTELYVLISLNECLEIIKKEFKAKFVDEYVRKYNGKILITILIRPDYCFGRNTPVLSIVIDNFEKNTKIYGTITGSQKYIKLVNNAFNKYIV